MAKKRATKKQIVTFKKEIVLWAIILILIILQGISAWHIVKLREYADSYSDFTMSVLLKRSEEDRYKYPVIDIAENRVYVPEAHIYLPLNEASRNMRYDYREYGAGFRSKALYFSTSSVVGQQSDARYDSCDKMVTLSLPGELQTQNDKPVGAIESTKDGLRDVFMHPDNTCWEGKWYSDSKRDLVEVVKMAKNY